MRIAMLTDLHFGEKNNSVEHNESLLDFIDWFIEKCKENQVDQILCMGDYFHTRNKLDVLTIDYGREGIKKLKAAYDDVVFLKGNHDLYYKNSNDVSSMNIFKDEIAIVEDFQCTSDYDGNVNLLYTSWISSPEMWDRLVTRVNEGDINYIFGHFEFSGFRMNNHYVMEHGNNHKQLKNATKVFTGHYHKRQEMDNVVYVGTPFPFNYSDVNDDERGMCILDTDTDEYWFINSGMNKIGEIDHESFMKQFENGDIDGTEFSALRVKIEDDVDEATLNKIQYALSMMEGLKDYKVDYTPEKINQYIQEEMDIQEVENIDQFVLDYLENSGSEDYDKGILKRLYKEQIEKESNE